MVLMVADVRRTGRADVSAAAREIREAGPRVLAGVLNNEPFGPAGPDRSGTRAGVAGPLGCRGLPAGRPPRCRTASTRPSSAPRRPGRTARPTPATTNRPRRPDRRPGAFSVRTPEPAAGLRRARGSERDPPAGRGRAVDPPPALVPDQDRGRALPPPGRDLPGQRRPGRAVGREGRKQLPVPGRHPPVGRVVRMGERQHHAVPLAQQPRLVQPHLRVRLLQDGEQRVILRQGDRQFHQVLVDERQIAAAAAWLRLVRIGIRIRRVVGEAEPRHQVPPPLRPRRPEPDRLPALGVRAHLRQPPGQQPRRAQVTAVVPEPVHADLAALRPQPVEQAVRRPVTQRDEVPRRPVAQRPFGFPQQLHLAAAVRGLHVVRQHQRPGPAVGPRAEERHRLPG